MIAYTNLITVRDECYLNLTNNYLLLHINLGQNDTMPKLILRKLKHQIAHSLFSLFSCNIIRGDKNKLNVKLTYKIFGPPTSINIDETAVQHRWFFSSFSPSIRVFPEELWPSIEFYISIFLRPGKCRSDYARKVQNLLVRRRGNIGENIPLSRGA